MHPYQNRWGKHQIGDDCRIGAFVEIGDAVIIGDNCTIGAYTFIPPGITIRDDVFVGPHVVFTNDKYPPSDNWEYTVVHEGASIGANATILPGIIIGKGAVIGAGAVVTKDIPPGETWVGNPAKRIDKKKE